jgi:NTE family protein
MRLRQLVIAVPTRPLALLAFLAWGASAQEPAKPRPKIGVALEGGGALGFAHIGLLEWFDEHRIPIDYIAGTSMGGLVGGLYSMGMRPAEIRRLISNIDWHKTLEGQVPFESLSYRRKEDRRAFQNRLEFGLRDGFNLPAGLTSDKNITFLLDRETLPYSSLKSFDELPTPFRCVATDLVSGKSFVFKDGPLGDALRATMSLPLVFAPVRRGGSLYADGGLLDNLPVNVVKGMGADIIIAVYLNSDPFKPQKNQSMLSVLNRSISVMIAANELHSLEMADLVISVDLHGFTSSEFTAGEKIIPRGYDAADHKSSLLTRLSLNEPAWQQYVAARDSRRIQSIPKPEFVQVAGADNRLSPEIEKTFADNVDKPFDAKRIERDIDLAAGRGRFSGFSYRMTELNGRQGLLVEPHEREDAPPFLNVGFLIDGSQVENVRFTANARITALDVAGLGSEWRTDLSAGSTWGLSSEFYKPLRAGTKWFISPRAGATSNPFDLYDRTIDLAQYRVRQIGAGLDFGYAIDRFSQIRVGYEAGYLQTSLQTGDPVLATPAGRVGITSMRYELDHLDSAIVPRNGQSLTWRTQWDDASPGARRGFPLSEMGGSVVRPVSARASVYLQAFGGTTYGYQQTGIPQFFLGGPARLSAYGTNELRTDQYVLGRLGYLYELFRLPPMLGNRVYATAAYEFADAFAAPGASRFPTDGSVALAIETVLGPLVLGGSLGDTGHHKVWFQLGRFF